MQAFLLVIQSGQPDPAKTICSIQGLSNVNLYDKVTYSCLAKDKYGNSVPVNDAARIYNSVFTCSINNTFMNNSTSINVVTAGQDPNNLGYLY